MNMRKFNKILSFIFFATLTSTVIAQDEIVKPEGNSLSIFDDSKVKDIRIVSSDSESLLIEVRCDDLGDKVYVFSGTLLDNRKKEMKSFSCERQEISKGSSTIDLAFTVSKKNSSTLPNLKSSYIKIKMAEKEDDSIFSDLENLVGGGGEDPLGDLFSTNFVFKYQKDWRLKGNSSMLISVPLTPIGSAKNLR